MAGGGERWSRRSGHGRPFLGRSLIVAPAGWPLAGPASADREEILPARADLAEAARRRQLNARNHLFGDLRTDVYGAMTAGEPACAQRWGARLRPAGASRRPDV